MTEDQEAEPDVPADDVDADDEATDEEAETDGLDYGDFVELEYTAYTVEGDQLVDTTDPDVAEEEGVDAQGQEFKARTIVLGEGHIFEGVEEALVGSQVGDEGSVTIPAEDAFGEYDPDDVQTVSAEKIDEDDRYPGANVQIDGQQGYISTIIGGRARVDFNHPLAGDDVEYEYEIVGEVEDREEQASGLFEMYLGFEPELWIETEEVEEEVPVEPDEDEEDDDEPAEPEFETELVEKESLYLEATPQMTMNQQWMMGKQQIGQEIIDQIGVDRIVVQEVIEGMGPMGGLGGMMGGGGGMGDLEAALEDADVDADEIVEELEADAEADE
ncbi:FKBP-type peptidyl-prolyl cis-trans isomerase [Natrarchaeobaculum aegyptiacum]|uniref:peptidylprolyl isomerase n=1 Tax=Natrarchaeobaculum aegyptiacum TaxID=745377 RepID=A0A2Z2I166_9EURY|nr:peptidylprolyl isomerase [Natrarchaeobaculum aegyptiacum]ARS91464.1 peptidylprolyl isomerase [Natrarchaeobaculum aegyptiacum]